MITLVVVSHNESNSIEKTIRSAIPLVSNVIIVCQAKSDEEYYEYEKVVNKLNSDVKILLIRTTNKGNADPDRNWAISLANTEYVLMLDSDEYIEESQIDSIKKSLEYKADAYWYLFKNIIKYNDVQVNIKHILGDDPHPRLFRRSIRNANGEMPVVLWSELAHRFPIINSLNQVFTNTYITHERDLEKLVERHLDRSSVIDDNARNMEKNFLRALFNSFERSVYEELCSKYSKLKGYIEK